MRRSGVILGIGAVLFVAMAGVIWRVSPKPGPVRDLNSWTWEGVPTTAEPLAGGSSDSCSLSERFVLRKQRRILAGEGEGVPAACKYVMHLDGWPEGEDECVLEFPLGTIQALETTTFGAWVAANYYRHRQGGNMFFTGPEAGRSFLSLDARWCKWGAVVDGIRALP